MNRFLVGITGGMAGGKSTVVRMLGEAGFHVVDADRVVADLYSPGGSGAQALKDLLGPEVLDPSGAVDKPKVAAAIFSNPDKRRAVEKAIHPLVHQRFREIAQTLSGVIVYEATLLVESGHSRGFDLTLSVEADEQIRLKRAVGRGMSESDARSRLKAQGDGEVRRRGVDRILWNDGSLEDLQARVGELVAELKSKI